MHTKGSVVPTAPSTSPTILPNIPVRKSSPTLAKKTDMFVHFAIVAGERGVAYTERDILGFAMKFYTEEGSWDLVGNDTPVFYLRDPLKFPDLNHVVKRDPHNNLRNQVYKWDFFSLKPESLHQLTIYFSDRGLPKSYRHMYGFGSHTYSFINADNQRFWMNVQFICQHGIENLMDDKAESIIPKDRESSQCDLFEAIERGDFPR